MPIYHGSYGWWYLCIWPIGSNLTIEQSLNTIQYQYPHSNIIVQANGSLASQWWMVEQNINNQNYSEHVAQWTIIYRDNKWTHRQWQYDELINSSEADIMLDSINRKCFVKWAKVTSDQLKSQSTTTEILIKLLESKEWRIQNNELEPSSYSRQQNQMLWKIILPLKRLTKEIFGEELIIECHGTLREFDLILQPNKLIIWYISKLWQ